MPGAVGCMRPAWGGEARDPARSMSPAGTSGHYESQHMQDQNATTASLFHNRQERSIAIFLRETQYVKGLLLSDWRKGERVAHAGTLPPANAIRPENNLPE
jgi:hypothetical protein